MHLKMERKRKEKCDERNKNNKQKMVWQAKIKETQKRKRKKGGDEKNKNDRWKENKQFGRTIW